MQGRSRRGPLLTTGALFLAALCWGLAPVATRYLLASFNPLQLVVLRFLIASLFLLPLLLPLRHHRWTLQEVGWTIFCGMAGVIGYNVPVAYGLRVLPSGIAGLLIATEPIWILLIAALALRERISWSVLLGLFLSLAGIALLLSQETFSVANGLLGGTLLVLLAALMWSIYTVSIRPLSKKLGARTSTALTLVTGTLPLLAFGGAPAWPLLLHLSSAAWLALALLVLGSTVAATILWNYGVARTASSQAGLFLYLVPLVSIAGGALFLHEQISLMALGSGLLIIAGVVLAQIARPPQLQRNAGRQDVAEKP